MSEASDFDDHPNLASARLGAVAVAANDEFFAPKESLVSDVAPVFLPGEYTDRGKWMDGWETRRRRYPGHDWCIVRLGAPGVVRGVVVDTAHFTGNYPESASVEGASFGSDEEAVDAPDERWLPLVPKSPLAGGTENRFPAQEGRLVTHVRLNIFPDGGVARLRVHGRIVPRWAAVAGGGQQLDLASVENGARVAACSDEYFCEPGNLLLPGAALNMGDGWETRRRRDPSNDWVVVRFGVAGTIERVEVDTSFYKGNAPGWISLSGKDGGSGWRELLPQSEVRPDSSNVFEIGPAPPVRELRLDIYPDGGVARLRVWGRADPRSLADAGTDRLNVLDTQAARPELVSCCGSNAWVERVLASRPYQGFAELLATSGQIWWELDPDDWMEAFRAHPRIGERAPAGAPGRAAVWSGEEQAAVQAAGEGVAPALAQANSEYERRFDHTFIVFATGKTPEEMLRLLEERLANDPAEELEVAAAEQAKITRLRLHKLMGVDPGQLAPRSAPH